MNNVNIEDYIVGPVRSRYSSFRSRNEEIRNAYDRGEDVSEIAARYGLSIQRVQEIIRQGMAMRYPDGSSPVYGHQHQSVLRHHGSPLDARNADIREAYKNGEGLTTIAARYNISRQWVHMIARSAMRSIEIDNTFPIVDVDDLMEKGLTDRKISARLHLNIDDVRHRRLEKNGMKIEDLHILLKEKSIAAIAKQLGVSKKYFLGYFDQSEIEENRRVRVEKKMAMDVARWKPVIDKQFDDLCSRLGFIPSSNYLHKFMKDNGSLFYRIIKCYGSYKKYCNLRGVEIDYAWAKYIANLYLSRFPDDKTCIVEHFERFCEWYPISFRHCVHYKAIVSISTYITAIRRKREDAIASIGHSVNRC